MAKSPIDEAMRAIIDADEVTPEVMLRVEWLLESFKQREIDRIIKTAWIIRSERFK